MKHVMRRALRCSVVLLVAALLALPSPLLSQNVIAPDKGRIIEETTYRNSSAIDILSANYSDLLSAENSENSQRKELRLAMSLKIYDAAFNHINPASSSDNADRKRFLPSPSALIEIDSMLASLNFSSGIESD